MKIVIATPLFPPDTADPARYAKDLATRLKERFAVTLVLYASIPESVPGATLRVVHKKLPRVIRVLLYTASLLWELRGAKHVIAINGPSVELPLLIASYLTSAPITLVIADEPADARAQKHALERFVRTRLHARVNVCPSTPLMRPEILPFETYPLQAFERYEESWNVHLSSLSL